VASTKLRRLCKRHVVVGEEDVAGIEFELNGVGGIVQGAVEDVERLALAVAQRPSGQVVAQLDVEAVVANADALRGVGEDRAERYRLLARSGLLRAVEAEGPVEFVHQFGRRLQQRVVGGVAADHHRLAAGLRLAQAQQSEHVGAAVGEGAGRVRVKDQFRVGF
jgi:hypothetical protein